MLVKGLFKRIYDFKAILYLKLCFETEKLSACRLEI